MAGGQAAGTTRASRLIRNLLGLAPVHLQIVTLHAALPTASSAFILAARMGGAGKPVAALISLGTLLSMVTMPVWVALLSG